MFEKIYSAEEVADAFVEDELSDWLLEHPESHFDRYGCILGRCRVRVEYLPEEDEEL